VNEIRDIPILSISKAFFSLARVVGFAKKLTMRREGLMSNPAKQCTKCKKIKELSEFGFAKGTKDGFNFWCRACIKDSNAAYRLINPDKAKASHAAWVKANPEKNKANKATWIRSNRGKKNAWNMEYKAAKLQAAPKWLTKTQLFEIESFYVEAAKLTKETGIPHEVDHITPLQGKNVSGLHVPWNLQILTKSENSSKGNRLIASSVINKKAIKNE
jgi:hypothetical protein